MSGTMSIYNHTVVKETALTVKQAVHAEVAIQSKFHIHISQRISKF